MDPAIINRLQAVGMNVKEDANLKTKKRASVLLPLLRDGSLVLTQRPTTLRSHGGEVCFPGGKQDEEDEKDDIKTALREAQEEIGLTDIQPLSRFPAIESYHGLCVTPVVGLVQESVDMSKLQISEDEVEAAFLVPLMFFAEDSNLSGPAEPWRTYHYTYNKRTFTIWGLTAYIAHQVASVAAFSGKGHLYRYNDTSLSWKKRYFESGGGMLHEYTSARHVKQSASKKNRLPLKECQVSAKETLGATGRFQFQISALQGRVCWQLAAETETERQQWMALLCGNGGTRME